MPKSLGANGDLGDGVGETTELQPLLHGLRPQLAHEVANLASGLRHLRPFVDTAVRNYRHLSPTLHLRHDRRGASRFRVFRAHRHGGGPLRAPDYSDLAVCALGVFGTGRCTMFTLSAWRRGQGKGRRMRLNGWSSDGSAAESEASRAFRKS